MRFSTRTSWELEPSELAKAIEAKRAEGTPLLDLTESNPTRCGLKHDAEALEAALGGPELATYEPDPQGAPPARAAIAQYYAAKGRTVSPDELLLTASTSEAYAYLFKLLCDPGDTVLAPRPSYPLFDYLAGLEAVTLRSYELATHDDFALHVEAVEAAADDRTRAVLVVSPHNPTGRTLREQELTSLAELCARRGWALIVDEVFADYSHDRPEAVVRFDRLSANGGGGRSADGGGRLSANEGDRLSANGSVAGRELPCLAFVLSGLSKVAALPQLKLGWIAIAGPEPLRRAALARLEVIADTWLSVASPVQHGAAKLLALAGPMQQRIRERLAHNRETLARLHMPTSRWNVLPSEGGWSAVLRVPREPGEDALALALLDAGVIVQPGYFYDFPRGTFLVVSLLPEPSVFEDGVRRLAAVIG